MLHAVQDFKEERGEKRDSIVSCTYRARCPESQGEKSVLIASCTYRALLAVLAGVVRDLKEVRGERKEARIKTQWFLAVLGGGISKKKEERGEKEDSTPPGSSRRRCPKSQ